MSGELSLSLYEIERGLMEAALAHEENPEDESLALIVREYMAGAADKRDRVAQFHRHLIAAEDMHDSEIKRLTDRKRAIGAHRERLERYVISVMQASGTRKLEGNLATFSLSKRPDSVEILDPAQIPDAYCDATIRIHGEDLTTVHAAIGSDRILSESRSPRKREIKAAIETGEEIAGADVVFGEDYLQVK